MTYDDFKKLKIGDHVLITNCGLDSGTECVIFGAKYEGCDGPKFALEPVDPYSRFVCGNGRGTRRKIIRSCGVIQRVSSANDEW